MRCRKPTIIFLSALLWGMTRSGGAQQTFRAGVSLVVVDMRVLNGDRQVPDLRADEVTLLVDGKPRPIVSLTFSSADSGSSPHVTSEDAAASKPAPATGGPRRLVLVVDRGSFNPGEASGVQVTARHFLERLPKGDVVAVAPLPVSGTLRFERDRQATANALDAAFKGAHRRAQGGLKDLQPEQCDGSAALPGCQMGGNPQSAVTQRARRMDADAAADVEGDSLIRNLQWLLIVLATADGPTDVVLIHGGLPDSQRMRPRIQRLIGTARQGRVRVHTLEMANRTPWTPENDDSQKADPSDPLSARTPSASAYDLAAETGGINVTRSSDGNDFFKQLERELAGTYLLSFEPIAADRDGKAHAIEIRVSRRPQPTIHARKAFVLGPKPPASELPSAETRRSDEPSATSPVPPPATAPPGPEPAPPASAPLTGQALRDVLERAAAYVARFEQTFSTVVAEERYVQVVKIWNGTAPSPGDEPSLAWRSADEPSDHVPGILSRRQLLSDVLLVQGANQSWMGYRDVAEVDGKSVRDRAVRVQQLFLSGTKADRRQLQRIADESARLNIGIERNVNTPTFPLQVLRASMLKRFGMTTSRADRQDADCCAVIGFREIASPTLVHRQNGADLEMTGELWIEPRTGRIRRAVIQFTAEMETVSSAFDVTYRPTPSVDVLVPDRFWEWVRIPDLLRAGRQVYVEGQASYGNLRRFSVSTEESLK